ncbi:MAG: META domain-containing protein [Chitinophagales bacterium]
MKSFLLIILQGLVLLSCHQPRKVEQKVTIAPKDSAEMETTSSDIFSEKFKQGIDFTASGNEPFWSLEIDFSKSMHFKTLNGFEITTPIPEGVKAMDSNVTFYSAKTEQGALTVQLAKQECINDMSGKKLDYSVTVDAKNNTDKDYTTYKGCGQYLSDYRLHDIWVLESINDKKLKQEDFMKGLPQLELNLTEKKVFGHTGCNNLNGSLEVLGKKIQFGNLATTRMACKNMEFENRYLNLLSGQTVTYRIEPGKLYLQVSPDSVFIYHKTD